LSAPDKWSLFGFYLTIFLRHGLNEEKMVILALSAAFVGLVHSLAPGHWLPVVLMAKTRRWSLKTAVLGAIVAASGHIFLSILLGLVSIWFGVQLFSQYEAQIEKYAGLALGAFGLIYAGFSYFRHSSCHGHTHHGPDPRNQKTPFVFLFSLGLSPCVAVLPVFAAAASEGYFTTTMTLISFSIGVLLALVGSTLLVSLGLVKLDHPIFEHFGDVITGFGVALMGLILFFLPHA
jgi:ABC-type nickel/cobalt efflux system permease component RcnA